MIWMQYQAIVSLSIKSVFTVDCGCWRYCACPWSPVTRMDHRASSWGVPEVPPRVIPARNPWYKFYIGIYRSKNGFLLGFLAISICFFWLALPLRFLLDVHHWLSDNSVVERTWDSKLPRTQSWILHKVGFSSLLLVNLRVSTRDASHTHHKSNQNWRPNTFGWCFWSLCLVRAVISKWLDSSQRCETADDVCLVVIFVRWMA